MSEPTGDTPQAPAADETPQLTDEQLAAAREQLQAMGELNPTTGGPAASSADLGIQAVAEGAQADSADPAELLRSIKALQAQVDQLNRERQAANVPDVVKYTTAIADHLQARADQHPTLHANPDQTWMPALETAAATVNAATEAAQSGDITKVLDGLRTLREFFDRHGRKNPTQDYGYLHELASEAEQAARKAA